MRRTKEWWSRLSKGERVEPHWLEVDKHKGSILTIAVNAALAERHTWDMDFARYAQVDCES